MKTLSQLLKINFYIVVVILFALQIHNALLYPVTKGFDANDHIFYIETIKNEHRFPLANEGGQTDHPPLYFWVASIFPSIEMVKVLGVLAWVTLLLISYFYFNRILNNRVLALIGTVLVGSLPAVIYTTPQISNELFSAVMVSATLAYYTVRFNKEKEQDLLILGTFLGLCILSKVTGVVLILSIIVDLLLRNKKNIRNIIPTILLLLTTTLLVGGSFYLRNFILFHNPFIITTDFPGQELHQLPGYRDLRFFTDVSGFLKLDLFHANYYSLWAGTYFSWFYDGHNSLIPVQEFSKSGVLLVIASIPISIISLIGIIREIKNTKNLLLIMYPALLFIFYIYFNLRLPYYSSVKGIYLLSAVLPFTYFILKGLESMPRRFFPFFIFYLDIYVLLVTKNFWILPQWVK